MPVNGAESEVARLMAEVDAFKEECVEKTKNAARVLTDELMARTPVWSGKTVRNFAWGAGSSPSGGMQDPIGGTTRTKDDPGATSLMALGSEPRREENENAAKDDMESVLDGVTELTNLSVTNFSDIWDLVDNGSAPTPERARNPGGVSVLAEQAAISALGDDFK